MPGEESQLYLLLKADFTAVVLDGENGNPTGEVGNWTQVYDQSIVVELLNDHKAKYMANMRYTIKDDVSKEVYGHLNTNSRESFDSDCSGTMVGVKFNEDS